MREAFGVICTIACIIVVFISLLFGAAYGLVVWECNGMNAVTGLDTRVDGGVCYANVDGKWVPGKFVFGTAHEVRIKAKP